MTRCTSHDQVVQLFNELLASYRDLEHLRIGQLIVNACAPQDLFYVENDELIERLKRYRQPGERTEGA